MTVGITHDSEFWAPPVKGVRIPDQGTRSFGVRRTADHVHQGIDLFAPLGTPVWAVADGRVSWAIRSWRSGFSGYGRVVVLELKRSGLHVLYSHLDRVFVAEGDDVLRGTQIGTVGKTAFRRDDRTADFRHSRPHLHFEVSESAYPQRSEDPRIDPLPFFTPAPHRRTTPGQEATIVDDVRVVPSVPPVAFAAVAIAGGVALLAKMIPVGRSAFGNLRAVGGLAVFAALAFAARRSA